MCCTGNRQEWSVRRARQTSVIRQKEKGKKKAGHCLNLLKTESTPIGKNYDHILACILSELPASHGLHFSGNLQYVLLRRVEMTDSRSQQVLDESRLIPVLGRFVVIRAHFLNA